MDEYFVGVDAGGTKTELRVISPHRLTVERVRLPGFNYQSGNLKEFVKDIRNTLDRIKKDHRLERYGFMVAGVAGVFLPYEKEKVAMVLEELTGIKTRVMSDMEILLYGTWDGEPGMVLIAGTGSIAAALLSDGKVVRKGGYGYIIGDIGSGAWFGLNAVRAALNSFEGLGPKTILQDEVFKFFGAGSPRELIGKFYAEKDKPGLLGKLFPIILDSYFKGDAVSEKILEEGMEGLVNMLRVIREETDVIPRVLLSGGLFKNSSFHRMFIKKLKGFSVEMLGSEPSYLAAKLALKFYQESK